MIAAPVGDVPLDALRDLAGPGLVFFLLVVWLVRKAWKAARTESALEENRRYDELQAARAQALGDKEREARLNPGLRARLVAGGAPSEEARDGLAGADLSQATAPHVALVGALLLARFQGDVAAARALHGEPSLAADLSREWASSQRARIEVVWVRSLGSHAAWLERRPGAAANAEVLCVVRVSGGLIAERWTFR